MVRVTSSGGGRGGQLFIPNIQLRPSGATHKREYHSIELCKVTSIKATEYRTRMSVLKLRRSGA